MHRRGVKRFKQEDESDMAVDDDSRPPHRLHRPSSVTVSVVSLHCEEAPYSLDRRRPLRDLAAAVFDAEPCKLRPFLGLVYARGHGPFTPDSVLDHSALDASVGDFLGRRAPHGFRFHVVALVTVVALTAGDNIRVAVTGQTRVRDVRDAFAAALGEGQEGRVRLHLDGLTLKELPDPSLSFAWWWAVDGVGDCVYATVEKGEVKEARAFWVQLLNGMKGTTGRNLETEVTGETLVLELKQRIREEHRIGIGHQVLLYQGEELDEHQPLHFYDIRDGATLHLRCHCP